MKRYQAGVTAAAALSALLAGVGWIGLKVKPVRKVPEAGEVRDFGRIYPPSTLPAPVKRYFERIAHNYLPITNSAIVWGRPTMRMGRLQVPLRFTSYIDAGNSYLREIDVAWFGLPVMRVVESYIDGLATSVVGREAHTPSAELNQAACLNLWAEALWTPSVLLTDPRVRWVGIDDTSAWLYVPFGDGEEAFKVTFDPLTGLIASLAADRFKDGAKKRVRWTCRPQAWLPYGGIMIPTQIVIQWADDAEPWTIWTIDGILYNEDVSRWLPSRQPAPSKRLMAMDSTPATSVLMPNASL